MQPMIRRVNLGKNSYNVIIGDKLPNLGKEMRKTGLKGNILVFSHPRIMHLHGKFLLEGLGQRKQRATVCEIPEGESSKSKEGLDLIFRAFEKNKIERKDIVICFGGGVIGDLVGYAAASWSRGINVVQVPTTLIAQTDSSIGGKTGIDWGRIKNKVGAFKQPKLVFMDVSILSTLSKRQFSNGMAEVIKYGLLDENIWTHLLYYKSDIAARDLKTLADIVWKCANLKCDIVEKDEFDTKGIRAKLNLGHTVGHAVEGASNFKLLHGEAISLGLIAAARLSIKKLGLSCVSIENLANLLNYFDLPISFEGQNKDLAIKLMYSDKKVEDGKPRFVLFKTEGKVSFPHKVREKEVREAMDI